MSDKKLKVNIYTPDSFRGSYDTGLLVCPATDGEIGIMADHMPMVCALKEGKCRIKTEDGTVNVDISKGLLCVKDNVADIFCEK